MALDEAAIRRNLTGAVNAAIAAADAGRAVLGHLPPPPKGRTLVLAAGKAAAPMAAIVERLWDGAPLEGLVVTPPGHGLALRRLRSVEAGHPVPDLRGQAAAAEILLRAAMLGPDDLLLVLLSGGASALLPAPRKPAMLVDLQRLTRALLASGAPIAAINAVRKHLSRLAGGGLARAAGPCPIVVRAVSDVAGDDPSVIGSGPLSPDPTSREDAIEALRRYGVEPPERARAVLEDPACETPFPGDPAFDRVDYGVVLAPRAALDAMAGYLFRLGYEPFMFGDRVEGEAREVGRVHAGMAIGRLMAKRRTALISGGELTVTGAGADEGEALGGPNREYALAAALELQGRAGVAVAAMDSDGLDGTPDAAGAMVLPSTLRRAQMAGLQARASLDRHDSGGFFARLGDALISGPTRTNVNDVRVMLVDP